MRLKDNMVGFVCGCIIATVAATCVISHANESDDDKYINEAKKWITKAEDTSTYSKSEYRYGVSVAYSNAAIYDELKEVNQKLEKILDKMEGDHNEN